MPLTSKLIFLLSLEAELNRLLKGDSFVVGDTLEGLSLLVAVEELPLLSELELILRIESLVG